MCGGHCKCDHRICVPLYWSVVGVRVPKSILILSNRSEMHINRICGHFYGFLYYYFSIWIGPILNILANSLKNRRFRNHINTKPKKIYSMDGKCPAECFNNIIYCYVNGWKPLAHCYSQTSLPHEDLGESTKLSYEMHLLHLNDAFRWEFMRIFYLYKNHIQITISAYQLTDGGRKISIINYFRLLTYVKPWENIHRYSSIRDAIQSNRQHILAFKRK